MFATTCATLALALATPSVPAEDAYLTLTVGELHFEPGAEPALRRAFGAWELRAWPQPTVRCAGAEAYLGLPWREAWNDPDVVLAEVPVAFRAAPGAELEGELWLPGGDGLTRHPFTVRVDGAAGEGRADFLRCRYLHYAWRHALDLPGAAWFRHRARADRAALAQLGVEVPFDPERTLLDPRGRRNDVDRTYDLFTGGRALAENLALDEALEPVGADAAWVALDEIEGISTRAIDWGPRLEGADPELDPLAALVPADQHALFFPSFAALVRVHDEAARDGTPVLELLDASSEDARTRERYERQLCLPLDPAARALGGTLIESVAITGSDPYLRTGSDVAVILRGRDGETLEGFLAMRQEQAAVGGRARLVEGVLAEGLAWRGVVSEDRSVCSYRWRLGDDVVVTNSLAQLERLADVAAGVEPALAGLEEYRFFRQRYARGEREDAFLVVSDPTIRRWCGPRWRIAASRRTRAAALLAEQRAADLAGELLEGARPAPGVVADVMPLPGGGALLRTDDGPRSEVYGTDRYLTPIVELDLERVTTAERDGYNRWRGEYERRWRQVFDPIAARLTVSDGQLELDLSVVPLVLQSEYRDLANLTHGATLPPLSGDQHGGSALHFAMALGRESRWFGELGNSFGRLVAPEMTDPLGWLGEDLSIWVDDDAALWEQARESGDPEDFLEENLHRLPVALRVSARDPLRMALFMSALRGWVQGSAPNLVRFEAREHAERGYVAIVPEDLRGMIGTDSLVVYYVTLPDALVFSLSEPLIQRVIERDRGRAEGASDDSGARPWLGGSAALRLGPGFQDMLATLVGEQWSNERRRLAWRALPILDEWRRLAPDADPVAFHAEHFGVRPVCPGGQGFALDREWGAMASVAYGHPGQRRAGPSLPPAVRSLRGAELGVTFEDDGLRARVRLER